MQAAITDTMNAPAIHSFLKSSESNLRDAFCKFFFIDNLIKISNLLSRFQLNYLDNCLNFIDTQSMPSPHGENPKSGFIYLGDSGYLRGVEKF